MTPKHFLPQPPKPVPAPAGERRRAADGSHDTMFGETCTVEHEQLDLKNLPRISTWAMLLIGLIVVAMFAGLFMLGYIPYRQRMERLAAEAKEARDTVATVEVMNPEPQPKITQFMLPGDVRAYQETAMYPRALGYLKAQYADIGDVVKAGQLLAEIDSPDLDAQIGRAQAALSTAKADLAKAESDRALAQSTLDRYEQFAKEGGVTKQQLEERQSAMRQTTAAVAAAEAAIVSGQSEVTRITKLQQFEKIIAPFAGKITARGYDIGALLSQDTSSKGPPMFSLAEIDTLRVYVDVPQAYVTMLHEGQDATLEVRNYPDRRFTGKVTRSTGEVNAMSRTVRFEIDYDNADGLLLPGMYAQVRFQIDQPKPSVTVASSALVFTPTGISVGVVRDNKAHFQPVSIGRDFGATVEIIDGVTADDLVVTNPGERLTEGAPVRAKLREAAGSETKSKP